MLCTHPAFVSSLYLSNIQLQSKMAVSKTLLISLMLCSKISSALQAIAVGSKLHTKEIIYIYLCMKKGHVSRVYTVRAQCIAQKHTATRLVQYVQIQTAHPTLECI